MTTSLFRRKHWKIHNLFSSNRERNFDKNEKEITKTISYRLQCIDSIRFMASSFSNLVNNLAERINKFKCKYEHDHKKCEFYEIR